MFRRKPAANSEVDSLRARQITALKQSGLRLKPQDADESVWDVIVANRYGDLSFRVLLPKDFPETAPEFRLLVQAQHPWVASNLRIVGYPKAGNWTPHSSLASIVAEISAEFTRNPPLPNGFVPGKANEPLAASPPGALARPVPEVKQEPVRKTAVPDVPSSFPVLDGLSTAQLQELLQNPIKFSDVFEKLESVIALNETRDSLYEDVERVAQANLLQKEQVQKLKADVGALQQQLALSRNKYQELAAEQHKVMQSFAPSTLISQLAEASAAADKDSERIREQFAAKTMDIAAFVKEYLASRTKYHARASKEERLRMGAAS